MHNKWSRDIQLQFRIKNKNDVDIVLPEEESCKP